MSQCYRCGKSIPPSRYQLRRKVKTGEWLRRNYAKDKVSSVNVHYGIRIVCKSCARSIDAEARRLELLKNWELGIALFVLLVLICMRIFG